VAFELLLDQGPLTRRELRALTGLSGPTIAALVHRLEAAGLVAPVGEAGTDRRGPNARLYGIVADRAHVAGVEVRPDDVLAAVTDLTGTTVGSARVSQDPGTQPDRIIQAALDGALADAGLSDDRLRMVVVGTPGLVDPETGDVSFVARLPTWHANVLPGLRDRYGDRVELQNEVNLVGYAEHRLGAARGHDTFALLFLGEGIGTAIVLNGRVLRGASGGAGEVAYLPLGRGTLQDLAGGPAVRELAREHGIPVDTSGDADTSSDVADPSSDLAGVVRGAVDGGPAGEAFLDALADRVSQGAAALCAVVDPGFLVLAGEVGRAGGVALARRVEERLSTLIPLPTRVAPGGVDGNAVVRGAVLVALDHLHRETFGLDVEV
jgi:predicted NBD/HSP70 family sugar kinase